MERTLSVERLYYLGDYKNIKFGNTLTGIPEELAMNGKAVELLYLQQFVACEMAYRKYVEMLETITDQFSVLKNGKKVADPQAVMEFLQEQRTQSLKDLFDEIQSVNKKMPEAAQEESQQEK